MQRALHSWGFPRDHRRPDIRRDSGEPPRGPNLPTFPAAAIDPLLSKPTAALIPVPLSRLVLIALGARVGEGTYSSGLVFDPHFVTIGSGTQLGFDCLVVPHAQAGGRLAHHSIRIGSGVTIGGRSVIMAGARIDDGAVIGFCSLVTAGTHVGAGEVWAGTPARPIRRADGVAVQPERQ